MNPSDNNDNINDHRWRNRMQHRSRRQQEDEAVRQRRLEQLRQRSQSMVRIRRRSINGQIRLLQRRRLRLDIGSRTLLQLHRLHYMLYRRLATADSLAGAGSTTLRHGDCNL